jgi:diguanylate cyclase (GGDEF)-like protein
MTLGAALLTGLYAGFPSRPPGVGDLVLSIAIPTLLTVFGIALLRSDVRRPSLLWVMTPVLGTVAVAVLDLATRDASAAGQVFLCFPVLFAASQLRPAGAVVAAASAIVANVVVAFSLEPAQNAITDVSYVGATLIGMTVLLVSSGMRLERLIERLERQAAIDPLTGLVTRRVLDDAAKCALGGTASEDGIALILLDIDRFKTINDTYGHPVGDDALSHVGEVLRNYTRPDAVISRLGGDELAVLLPGCSESVAIDRAQQLVQAIRANPLVLPDGTEVAISFSAGVSHAPRYAHDLRTLYTSADGALYNAKHAGRDQVGLPTLPTLPTLSSATV